MKEIVASARTAAPSTAPVSACSPEGRSSASTGARCALAARMASAQMPLTSRSRPVPKMPSTSKSMLSGSLPSKARQSPESAAYFRALLRASPERRSRSPSWSTVTLRPAWSARRATTKPSPPLFPVPTSTRIRLALGQRCSSSCQAASPARSMSSPPGMPYSSMARRSSSRTWSAR